jgi:hypothetical protein
LVEKLARVYYLTLWIIVVFPLSGCGGEVPIFSPTDTPVPTITFTAEPTATRTPTSTPLPPVAIFLSPPGADSEMADEIKKMISDWSHTVGYRFQVRPSLSEEDFNRDEIILVVAVSPSPNISSLVNRNPGTQFITVGLPGLDLAQNLIAVGSDRNRLDHQGFIAGYIAAMITPDWRVGVIGYSGSDETIAARQAFFTGVKFYCGLCRPSYAPFYEYPLFFELGADADSIAWRTAADYMVKRIVDTVYIVPGAGDEAMLRFLAENGVNIIAASKPLPEIAVNWVASLEFDLMAAFAETWQEFISGSAEQIITIPMQITNTNPELLTPGKQRLAEQVFLDVLGGYIDLGVDLGQE